MSKKEKREYIRLTTPRGVFIYPRLTEPDTKFVKPDGEYHTKFALDADDEFVAQTEQLLEDYIDEELPNIEARAKGLKGAKLKKVQKTIEQAQKRETNDLYEEEYDDEGEETGRVLFKFKLKAVVKTDKKSWTQQPRLFDAGDPDKGIDPQPIDPDSVNPWTGTEGKVNVEVFPYFMEKDGVFGLSLRLVGAQILKLVEGSSKGDAGDMGFGAEGGYTSNDSDDTDSGFDSERSDDEEDEDEF